MPSVQQTCSTLTVFSVSSTSLDYFNVHFHSLIMAAPVDDDEFEYYEYDETEAANGDGDYGDDAEYWYYDEVDETQKSPPPSVLAMIQKQYSQRLVLDQTPTAKVTVTAPTATSPSTLTPSAKPKSFRYRKRGQVGSAFSSARSIPSTSSVLSPRHPQQPSMSSMQSEESQHIAAIAAFKALLNRQRLDSVQGVSSPQDLQPLAAILEALCCGDPSVPPFIATLFQTTCDNMFGAFDLDLDALSHDFAALKRLFVDVESGALRIDRIMAMIENAAVSTVKLSNIAVTEQVLEVIIQYLVDDGHYDENSQLRNGVNELRLHRKS